jgi:hypothetical protein
MAGVKFKLLFSSRSPDDAWMMRMGLWILLGMGLMASVRSEDAVPWVDGERLRYEVHWGMVVAAQADMLMQRDEDTWKVTLDLKSRGMVETLYPIRSHFETWFGQSGLQARRYEAVRAEGKKQRNQLILLNTNTLSGVYEDRIKGTKKKFTFTNPETQTLLSLMAVARTVDWKPGVVREWDVCDRYRIKRVRMEGREEAMLPDAARDAAPCVVLQINELADAEGKVPERPLKARLWVRQADRVPERVDLQFGYGTFRLRRVEIQDGEGAAVER